MATFLPFVEKLAKSAMHRRGWQSRFFDTQVGRLHAFEAAGQGTLPTVVLVHGLSSNALAFANAMARIRRQARRVIALELPGHGFSEEPRDELTIERLFDSTNTALDAIGEPFVLAGNSLGGAVAFRYAIHNPKNVRALALFSPAGAGGETEEGLKTVLSAFEAKTSREALALLRRIYHKQRWYLPLFALEFPDVLKKKAVRDITQTARPHHAIAPEELQTLSMPILFVWGRSERLLPARYLDYFRTHLPKHARIVEPDAMGHCPHFDDPRRMADYVIDIARAS